jgi:hypothetical protein
MIHNHAKSTWSRVVGRKRFCCVTTGTTLSVTPATATWLTHAAVVLLDSNFDFRQSCQPTDDNNIVELGRSESLLANEILLLLFYAPTTAAPPHEKGGVSFKLPWRGRRRDTGRGLGQGSAGQIKRDSFALYRSVKARRGTAPLPDSRVTISPNPLDPATGHTGYHGDCAFCRIAEGIYTSTPTQAESAYYVISFQWSLAPSQVLTATTFEPMSPDLHYYRVGHWIVRDTIIPEPSSVVVCLLGALGLATARRCK